VASGLTFNRKGNVIYGNIEARSCNHRYSGKAISITYSECVFVALGIQAYKAHAPYCYLRPAPLYNILPHYLINGKIFERGKKVTEHKMF
jgi:hypothetical protein